MDVLKQTVCQDEEKEQAEVFAKEVATLSEEEAERLFYVMQGMKLARAVH